MLSTPDNLYSSSTDPIQTTSSKSSDTQSGIGLPQNLFLEKHQSLASSSQLLNLFSYAKEGTQ